MTRTSAKSMLQPIRPEGPVLALVLTLAGFGVTPPSAALGEGSSPVSPQTPRSKTTGSEAEPTLRGRSGSYRLNIAVHATPSRAWAVLTNYEAMAGRMPDIQTAKVLHRSGSAVELQQTYLAPYTFGRRIRATLAMQETPPHRLSYRLIRGDALRDLKGSWSITPNGKGVLLSHQVTIDPVVPGFIRPIYDELSETNLRQSMRVLKRLMESP